MGQGGFGQEHESLKELRAALTQVWQDLGDRFSNLKELNLKKSLRVLGGEPPGVPKKEPSSVST